MHFDRKPFFPPLLDKIRFFFFYIWKILVWKNITNLQKAKAELLLLKVSMHFVLYLLRLGF